MLSDELQKKNCKTHYASRDADFLIVQKAVKSATTTNTVLVDDETGLIILLCYHASVQSHDHFFCREPRKNMKKPRIWNIKATKQMLGPDVCNHILFIHARFGCDTKSRLYGIGKDASLKRFKASSIFREQAKVFDTHSASTYDVVNAGEKTLVIIYNGESTDTLDSLRYQCFCEEVASKSSHDKPQTLPLTMEEFCKWTSSNRLGMAGV